MVSNWTYTVDEQYKFNKWIENREVILIFKGLPHSGKLYHYCIFWVFCSSSTRLTLCFAPKIQKQHVIISSVFCPIKHFRFCAGQINGLGLKTFQCSFTTNKQKFLFQYCVFFVLVETSILGYSNMFKVWRTNCLFCILREQKNKCWQTKISPLCILQDFCSDF